MANLAISTISVIEGASLTFALTRESSDAAAITIRWVITQKGLLPISASDFTALTGSKSFVGTDATYAFTIPTIEDTNGAPNRNFDISFYQVNTAPTADALIKTVEGTILEDDIISGLQLNPLADTNINVLLLGGVVETTAAGFGGDDYFIISEYQYGNVTIEDPFGVNVIRFDTGVSVTNIAEATTDLTVLLGLTVEQLVAANEIKQGESPIIVDSVVFTLATGATVSITGPTGASYRYQIGDGLSTDYAAFSTALGTPTSSAPYVVTTYGVLPAQTGNVKNTEVINTLASTAVADILSLGGEIDITATGFGDDDYYIVSRYLSSAVTIADPFGVNIIKFDAGVSVTNIAEATTDLTVLLGLTVEQLVAANEIKQGESPIIVDSVVFTLATGATVGITGPTGATYRYQIAEGDVESYSDFRTALGTPTDSSPFIVPTPILGVLTAPDSGDYYFAWEGTKDSFQRYTVADDTLSQVTGSSAVIYAGNDLVRLGGTVDADTAIKKPVISLLDGSDTYAIQTGLNFDININDAWIGPHGFNLVRFDVGTSITDHTLLETTLPSGLLVAALTVEIDTTGTSGTSTDSSVTIQIPDSTKWRYQINDASGAGDIIDYDDFIVILDAIV